MLPRSEFPPTQDVLDSRAYVKQMRSLNPNYFALWHPIPAKSLAFRWNEIQIGDVGLIYGGTFVLLFNVTLWGADLSPNRRLPSHLEPLDLDIDEDVERTDTPTSIKPRTPYYGTSTRLAWEHAPSSDHEKFPAFKITKSDNGAPSYVLVAAEEMEEAAVKQDILGKWKTYTEKNYREWLRFAEEQKGIKLKPEELILVRGHVKARKWAIATLPKQGEYLLTLDTTSGIRAKLVHGETAVDGVHCGGDYPRDPLPESVVASSELAGFRIPQDLIDGRPCMRCIFILGLKMEKEFWTSRRAVTA